jgi:SMC interacting uncharacterized protein involved in chromosome segregation
MIKANALVVKLSCKPESNMEIVKIGFGHTSLHDFENCDYRQYCYMEASLEPGEDADEALVRLRKIVCSKIGVDIETLEERRLALHHELKTLQSRIDASTQKWNEIEEFMNKIGVNLEYDPLPF